LPLVNLILDGNFRLECDIQEIGLKFCNALPAQPIDATHALKRSAGVSNPSVLRGRSFNCRATAFNFA
jgi:hypothetical protein